MACMINLIPNLQVGASSIYLLIRERKLILIYFNRKSKENSSSAYNLSGCQNAAAKKPFEVSLFSLIISLIVFDASTPPPFAVE